MLLTGLNLHIRMIHGTGGEHNRSPGGELNDEIEIPQHEVASLCVIIVAHRQDPAPPMGQVAGVRMIERANLRTQVQGGGGPNGGLDGALILEVRLRVIEGGEILSVIVKKLRRIPSE